MRFLSEYTAERVRQLTADRGRRGGGAGAGAGRGRTPAFVRCTSAVAAGGGVGSGSGSGSDPAAQCYPGVIVDPRADQTTQPELGNVWLTLLDDNSAVAVPTANKVYECLLAGSLTIGTDTRPRAFGTAAGDFDPCNPPTCPPPPPVTLPGVCPTGSGSGSGSLPPDWDCVWVAPVCGWDGRSKLDDAYVLTCADLAGRGIPDDQVCGWVTSFGRRLTGAALTSFLADLAAAGAGINYVYCTCPSAVSPGRPCPDAVSCLDGVKLPRAMCVAAGNGTRALAGIGSAGGISTNTGAGWPVNLSAGGVTITGVLAPCPCGCGLFFSGTITSTNPDPDNSPLYDCGCVTTIGPCAPDGADVTQAVVSSDWAVPTQTLRITTACGVVDLIVGPCAPPATYNCVAGNCVDPGDGTGTYAGPAALGDCEAAGCAPVPWYCIRLTGLDHTTGSPSCLASFPTAPGSWPFPGGPGAWPLVSACSGSDCCYYTYEIVSGPYDTQAEADAACG